MTNYIWGGSTWTIRNGKPVVVLFGRNVDEPMKTVAIGLGNQRPYFYAPTEETKQLHNTYDIVEMQDGFIDAFGRNVTRCYTRLPSDVPKVRGLFSFTCEADILYDYRYVIDHKIYYGFDDKGNPVDIPMMSPRTCMFDIEVATPEGEFADPLLAQYPISQIQVYDSYTDEIRVWNNADEKVAPDHYPVKDEVAIINAFVDWVWETDPDIVTGWYTSGFDIPYIMRRAQKINLRVSKLSRWPQVYPDDERWTGRELFDMLIFYKDWSKPKGQLPTYDLKFVCKHECGWTYTNYGDQIRQLVAAKDWKTLVDYGRNDVLALRDINKKTGLIDFYESLRRMTGIKLTDCLQRSKIIELYLMHKVVSYGEVMPLITKKHDAQKIDYEGALVLPPEFGIHEDVGTTDLKALYPSIILAYNLSPDRLGMIPKVIVELMEAREVMRRLKMEGKASEAMKTSEQSLKYVINAFYGYLAFTGARLHKPELAAFITKTGRDISYALHKQLVQMGKTIVYGDTDSTFVKPVMSPEEGLQIQDALNAYLLQWAREHKIADHLAPTLKFEKLYKKLMFKKKAGSNEAAKKRYAGVMVWKDGKDLTSKPPEVDYTGLETKRSDTAEVSRHLMKEFFKLVLIESKPEEAVQLIKETRDRVLKGEIPLRELAIPKGITKGTSHLQKGASPWIRGKENGRVLLGIKFRADKKPKLLYCLGSPDVICIDDDVDSAAVHSVAKVDWSTMAEKTIDNKMQSLVESIGINWDAKILGQTNLMAWC